MEDAAPELAAGSLIAGRYRIERLLGRGGMGAVYEATHVELGRRVALKVLRREVSADGETVERFIQEARIAAAIGHTGIVDVFDLGVADSGVYLAMEKLQGVELADRIESGEALSERESVEIAIEIAGAIEAAHEHGVVHRDLKPQNVFLSRPRGATRDVVKVLDFGVAKLSRADGQNLTQTGTIYGTPAYMPPEQLRGVKDIDGRADVYAVGCILYEMLTRQRPFDADSLPELVLKIVSELPRSVSKLRADLSPEIETLVLHAMAPRREERFESMARFREALVAHRELLGSRPPSERRSHVELGTEPTMAQRGSGPLTPANVVLPSITDAGKTTATTTTDPPPASAPSVRPQTPRTAEVSIPPALDADTERGTSLRPAAPRQTAPWIVAAVALGACVGLAGYVASTSGPTPGASPTTTSAPEAPAPSTPAAPSVPAPAPPPEPPPAARRVAFTSDPLGVQIVLGDDTCTAPCTFDVSPTVTAVVARYPERPEVTIPIAWPPPAAMHVSVPASEPVRTSGSVRRTSGTHAPPSTGTTPPPLLPR